MLVHLEWTWERAIWAVTDGHMSRSDCVAQADTHPLRMRLRIVQERVKREAWPCASARVTRASAHLPDEVEKEGKFSSCTKCDQSFDVVKRTRCPRRGEMGSPESLQKQQTARYEDYFRVSFHHNKELSRCPLALCRLVPSVTCC